MFDDIQQEDIGDFGLKKHPVRSFIMRLAFEIKDFPCHYEPAILSIKVDHLVHFTFNSTKRILIHLKRALQCAIGRQGNNHGLGALLPVRGSTQMQLL